MINIKTVTKNVKDDILKQVTKHICTKYNCKPSEVNAKFGSDGKLKVVIEPEHIDKIFDCDVTTVVNFKGGTNA